MSNSKSDKKSESPHSVSSDSESSSAKNVRKKKRSVSGNSSDDSSKQKSKENPVKSSSKRNDDEDKRERKKRERSSEKSEERSHKRGHSEEDKRGENRKRHRDKEDRHDDERQRRNGGDDRYRREDRDRDENRRDVRRDEYRNERQRRNDRDRRDQPRRDYRNGRRNRSRSRSYDHSNAKWGKFDDTKSKDNQKPGEKQKPNFGLSGKLTEETNTYRGVVIKYSEPPEARKPKRRWRLYPFKGEKALQTLYIHRESAYLIGRDRKVVDLPVDHPSCSKQHAALQYRLVPFTRDDGSSGKRVRPYIIDLESANGTFINNKKIEPKKYVELLEKDVIKFGFSSREYVLLHENSKDEAQDDDVKMEEEVNVKEEKGT